MSSVSCWVECLRAHVSTREELDARGKRKTVISSSLPPSSHALKTGSRRLTFAKKSPTRMPMMSDVAVGSRRQIAERGDIQSSGGREEGGGEGRERTRRAPARAKAQGGSLFSKEVQRELTEVAVAKGRARWEVRVSRQAKVGGDWKMVSNLKGDGFVRTGRTRLSPLLHTDLGLSGIERGLD